MIFSASRIAAFISCHRKWAFRYILGQEEGPTEATDIGKETHSQLELYVRYGRPIDMHERSGPLASALEPQVRHLVGRADVKTEAQFHFWGRHEWHGFKDLEYPGHVEDYKTSSDPNKWAPTPEQLAYDPQALLYAEDHFRKYNVPTVKLTWRYVSKKKPHRTLPVVYEMSRKHAATGFEVLEKKADAALLLTDVTKDLILQVPGNFSHCSAFGGCPHRAACGTLFNLNI